METPRTFSKLLINEPALQVLPSLACAIGLNEAMLLQQVHYWLLRPNAKIRDGRRWLYNSYPAWQEQFPFWSVSTIRRIIETLEKRGLLLSGNYNEMKIDKTKWYTIDYEALEALSIPPATTPPPSNPNSPSAKSRKPSAQNEQTKRPERADQRRKMSRPIPETTTETNNIEDSHTRARATAETNPLPSRNPAVTVTSPLRTQPRPTPVNRTQQLTPVKATVVDSFDQIPAAGASTHSDQERAAVADLFIQTYPLRNGILTDTPDDIGMAFMHIGRDAYYDVIRGAEHYAASAEAQRGIVMGAVKWLLSKQWQRWQVPEQPQPTTGGTTRGHYESKGERAARNLRLLAEECAPEAEDDQGADHQEPSRLLA